jgi:hypothetical protein
MDKIKEFIDSIVAGDNISARNNLDELLANKAYDALDGYKKQMASSLFGGLEQEDESEFEEENETDEE